MRAKPARRGPSRRLGLTIVLGLGCCLAWPSSPAGAATTQPLECQVTIGGVDSSSVSSPDTALEVDSDSTLFVDATAPGESSLHVDLVFGPVTWPVADEPLVGGIGSVELDVHRYAKFGVGLYEVQAVAGSCVGTGWIRVTGRSPLQTVAGLLAAAVALLGLIVLVWSVVQKRPIRGLIGGALAGLGGLVLAQQNGSIGITTGNVATWVGGPGAFGFASSGLRALTARPRAPSRIEPKAKAKPPAEEAPPTTAPLAPRPPHRRLLGQVSLPGSTEAITAPLQPNTVHEVALRIGFARPKDVSADRPLDESSLPPDGRSHRLRLTFQEQGMLGTPPAKPLMLAPAGDSDPVAFPFTTGAAGTYGARVIVSHGNRVMQTTRFEADLADGPPRHAGIAPIRLSVETNPRPSMRPTAEHADFDMALVVNHEEQGNGRVLVVHDGDPSVFDSGPFEETGAWFKDTLSKLAEDPDRYTSLDSPESTKLLRDMAIRGHDLFTHLLDWQVSDQVLHPTLGRIQLIPGRPDAFFPIEFVYDKDLPSDTAPVCPNAKQALEQGACLDSCPPGGDQHAVVCPIGFWCMSRVIERHPFLRSRFVSADESELVAEPVDGRETLTLFAQTIYGASVRVDSVKPGSIKLVADALARAVGHDVQPVGHWNEWRHAVASGGASPLVVVCHTEEKREASEPVLQFEIGQPTDHEWLGVNQIDASDVLGPGEAPPPVVLLIGCSTGVQRVEFQSSVAAFMRSGASIVLSTMATVLGEYAATITGALIDELGQLAKQGPTSLGEALLHIRRQMLAKGMPMVLSLSAFGDAEWRLTGRTV